MSWVRYIGLFLAVASCSQNEPPPQNPCADVKCSGHGICLLKNQQPFCECYLGYRARGLACVPDRKDQELLDYLNEPAGDEAQDEAENETQSGEPITNPTHNSSVGKVQPRMNTDSLAQRLSQLAGLLEQFHDRIQLEDCAGTQKDLLALVQGNRTSLEILAHQIPHLAKTADSIAELQEAQKFTQYLDQQIQQVNSRMKLFRVKCREAAREIGSSFNKIRICARSPGNGAVLNCLQAHNW